MPTAEYSLSTFLTENRTLFLKFALREGVTFSVKESSRCVTVRCKLPNDHVRFIVFDDHRVDNPHGEKPHVCNQWHKAVGDPISFTMGKEITDATKLHNVLQAAAIMCLTQSKAYNEIKEKIFS